MSSIFKRYIEFQSIKATTPIIKNKTVKYNGVQFKYADLQTIHAVVKPILSQVGLGLSYEQVETEKGPVLRCLIFDETGEKMTTEVLKKEGTKIDQKWGSEDTYGRRYLVCQLLALAAEDDNDMAHNQEPIPPQVCSKDDVIQARLLYERLLEKPEFDLEQFEDWLLKNYKIKSMVNVGILMKAPALSLIGVLKRKLEL